MSCNSGRPAAPVAITPKPRDHHRAHGKTPADPMPFQCFRNPESLRAHRNVGGNGPQRDEEVDWRAGRDQTGHRYVIVSAI